MAIEVYVNFNGNCREAVNFYKDIFGSKEPQFMTYGQAPADPNMPPIPEEIKDWVLHTELDVADSIIMFSDAPPFMKATIGDNISIALGTKSTEELTKWFNGLKDGGKVQMELQKTFWSPCYGSLVDKFGILWQLSLPPENM